MRDTSSVIIYRRLFKQYGRADVYVDGVYHSSFDNTTTTSLTGVFHQPYVIGGLDRGFSHRIVIKPQLNNRGKHKPFDIDYIEVRNLDAEGVTYLEDNYYDHNDPGAMSGGAISYQGSNWTLDNPTPNNPYTRLEANSGRMAPARRPGGGGFGAIRSRSSSTALAGPASSISISTASLRHRQQQGAHPVYDVPVRGRRPAQQDAHRRDHHPQRPGGHRRLHGAHADPGQCHQRARPESRSARDPMQSPVLFSGLWKVSGDYITTREKEAAISRLWRRRRYAGHDPPGQSYFRNIDIYIDNSLRTTAETAYLRGWPTPDETSRSAAWAACKPMAPGSR